MHPRLEEVLNYLDSERSALRDAVELVPARLRDQPPGPDRWSVAQVLQHLTPLHPAYHKIKAHAANYDAEADATKVHGENVMRNE